MLRVFVSDQQLLQSQSLLQDELISNLKAMAVLICCGPIRPHHLDMPASQVFLCADPADGSGLEVAVEALPVLVVLDREESVAWRGSGVGLAGVIEEGGGFQKRKV